MKIYFLPKMRLGWWAVGLIILFALLFFFLLPLLVESGQQGQGFNPILASATALAGIAGISALFTGIISIVKSRERSVLVFLTTLIGLFILFFVLGEFLYPH